MSRRPFVWPAVGLVTGLAVGLLGLAHQRARAEKDPPAEALEAVRAELDSLKSLLPDQAHAMADVGQHFTNLWFAAREGNWALGTFYLDETRSHLEWAVRIKPVRKDSAGHDVSLTGILESIKNTFFPELKDAIAKKDLPAFELAYRRTIEGCYGCHKTSEKPYLRLGIPAGRVAQIMNFDPGASWPQ